MKKDQYPSNPYITTHRKGSPTEHTSERTSCVNASCKLRKAGCYGAQYCPGYKARPEKNDSPKT